MADGLPDYVLDHNAVLKDTNVAWRHGQPPDYSKTRAVWAESKQQTTMISYGSTTSQNHVH